MKNSGRLHRTWWKFEELTVGDFLWLWRPICWITGEHTHNDCKNWNYGRTYCVYCDKTFSKDPWRLKRDQRWH